MKAAFLQIEFKVVATGNYEMSATITSLKSAKKMAEWYRSQKWCSDVRIMLGGAGGMEVA